MSISEIAPSVLEFGIGSDLFDCGYHQEDGTPLIGSYHYVLATTPEGRRFSRLVGVSEWINGEDERGNLVTYRSEEPDVLDAKSVTISNKLNAKHAPRLNPTVWVEGEAVYGSEEYCRIHGF